MEPISQIDALKLAAKKNPALIWYSIVDSAQNKSLPKILLANQHQSRCLFAVAEDSPIAANAPHLVSLDSPLLMSAAWRWIDLHAAHTPCLSILATELSFDQLYEHLHQLTEIVLPDDDEMFFAFWDPAILATLLGAEGDTTLHVRGPILSDAQRGSMTLHINAWWYWDRTAQLREVQIAPLSEEKISFPMVLNQEQTDALVEASVPDHVLYHITQNQAQLLSDIEPSQRYSIVQKLIAKARNIHIEAMSDLVNFVCAGLIYKEQFEHNTEVIALLNRVKQREISLTEALEQMP